MPTTRARIIPRRRAVMPAVRYGIPAALIVAGFVILFTTEGSLKWDGWAMCVGAGLSVLLLNLLFRIGAQGDREREDEERRASSSPSTGTGRTRTRRRADPVHRPGGARSATLGCGR